MLDNMLTVCFSSRLQMDFPARNMCKLSLSQSDIFGGNEKVIVEKASGVFENNPKQTYSDVNS